MKYVFKSTMALALVLALVLSCTVAGFAAEIPSNESNEFVQTVAEEATGTTISPRSNQYEYGMSVSTSWKTVATATTGFNCYVYIKCMNTLINDNFEVVPCDVRMLDKSGNVVWYESGAVPGQGSRIFWCGSDVYTIQIRTQGGLGTVYCYETTASGT